MSTISLPFTLKFYICDAIFLDIIPVIEPGGVCQVYQQTHLNLKVIKAMLNTNSLA